MQNEEYTNPAGVVTRQHDTKIEYSENTHLIEQSSTASRRRLPSP